MNSNAVVTRSNEYDLDSLKGLFALLLIHTVGPQTVIILPALVQGYVEKLGYSEQDAGFLASVETWGMFLATFAMMVLISRVSWRKILAAGLTVMVLTNALSIFVHDVTSLYVLRFLAGAGGGAIVTTSYALIGQTTNTSRNFGWAIFFVLVYGAVVFPVLPMIYEHFGIAGGFFFFAAFALCGLPFIRGLPDGGKPILEADPNAVALSARFKALAVLTMLLYFIAQIGVWSYFYRFGIRYGISDQSVGSALSISQFFGFAGAFSVVLFSNRIRGDYALVFSIGLTAVVIGALFGTHGFIAFVVIAGLHQFLWNATHPFLLGTLASFDPTGRVIVYGTAMQFLGVAVGPAIAAAVISEQSINNVLTMGIVFLLASLACILPPVLKERALVKAKAGATPGINESPLNSMGKFKP